MAVVLNLEPVVRLSRVQFYALCEANPDLQLERTSQGELVIATPVGGEGGSQEADYITDLNLWNRRSGLGKVFSSSTIFSLPKGGDRSPDAAWVRLDRWNALTLEQRQGFPPICPDFVIELRSPTDRLRPLRDKMLEYLENGLQLGWLINPKDNQVEIYRSQQDVEIVSLPATLSGELVLPGFNLLIQF